MPLAAPCLAGGVRVAQASCDPERIALVFNPASGTESCDARRAQLRELARGAGITEELSETSQEEGAAPAARRAVAEGLERLLVCGGDGSMVEAAEVLAGTDVALGVLPGGTANLLALNLGVPGDLEAALRLALTETPRPMDIGRANDAVFLILAGLGVDARMVRDATPEAKRRLGVLAYLATGWRLVFGDRIHYRITIDGRPLRRRAKTVVVANLGLLTGGVELIPGADPDDGLLEVAIVRAWSLRHVAAVALRAVLRRNRSDRLLEVHRGREIVVETKHPQPLHLDGNDAGTTTRLVARVEPRALKVVRPARDTAAAPGQREKAAPAPQPTRAAEARPADFTPILVAA